MPDEQNGILLPGDAGYVAPVETPETTTTEQQQGLVNTPTDSVVETPIVGTPIDNVPVEETPVSEPSLTSSQAVGQHLAGVRNYEPTELTQEKYDRLLSVYIKLKNRVGLDPSLEKQLDTEAGLY